MRVNVVTVRIEPMEIQFVLLQIILVTGILLRVELMNGWNEFVQAATRLTAAIKKGC